MMAAHDAVEADLLLQQEPARHGRWVKVGLLAGVVGLAGFAAGVSQRSMGMSAALTGLEQKEERMKIVPSYVSCSGPKDNCFETGCCKTSGHTCFVKSAKIGQCNETCTPGVHGFLCGVASNDVQSFGGGGGSGGGGGGMGS